jgi:hypothetical protein
MKASTFEFTVEQGIRVQRQQLAEWKSVLRPEAYDALVEYATRDNARAKDGHDIYRGTSLSGFVQGLCYIKLIKENLH